MEVLLIGYATSLQVWYSNVPHSRLVEDKGGQNWISKEKDKFKFPGGGTQFIHGADQYLDQINKVLISNFCFTEDIYNWAFFILSNPCSITHNLHA